MKRSIPSWLALCGMVAAASACSSYSEVHGPAVGAVTGQPSLRHHHLHAAAAPPGLDADHVLPLQEGALELARLDISQVSAFVKTPGYLESSTARGHAHTQPATQPGTTSTAPPLKAQLDYAHGRSAYLHGQRSQAISDFQDALREIQEKKEAKQGTTVDFDQTASAKILQMLGRVWMESGNAIRGADYLHKSAAGNPHDLTTLLLLGRFALSQQQWSDAVAIYQAALRLPPREAGLRDPALAPLLHYDLAVALRHAGFAMAAIEEYDKYFTAPRTFIRPNRLGTQLLYTDQQQGLTWEAVGDLYNQLNHPAEALAAYGQAEAAGAPDSHALLLRQIYSHLRLDDAEAAVNAAMTLIKHSQDDDQASAMIAYLKNQGVDSTKLALRLQNLYEAQGQPAKLALSIAPLLPRDQAAALLEKHLKAKPQDQAVFQALIHKVLLPADRAPADMPALQQAAKATAVQMATDPAHAEDHVVTLVTAASDPVRLVKALDQLPLKQRNLPRLLTIQAAAYAQANQLDQAVATYRQALKAAPKLTSARVGLAEVLIYRKQYAQAATVLKPLSANTDPHIVHLRVQVLTQTGHKDQALALLDSLIHDAGPVDLVLQKADLQVQLQKSKDAAQTLQDAINARPTNQRLYAALFQLYDSNDYQGDAVHGYEQLMQQMLQNIPHSRIARLKLAELHAVRGETDQAVKLLQSVLADNATDQAALQQLVGIYQKDNHHDDAVNLLETTITAHPQNQAVLQLALHFYEATDDRAHLLGIAKRLLALQPNDPDQAAAVAALYLHVHAPKQAAALVEKTLAGHHDKITNPEPLVNLLWRALLELHQPKTAEARIKAAIKTFPKAHANLNYELAMLYSSEGDETRAQQVLKAMLKTSPDHGPANNALGYSLAQQGKDLTQAEQYVARALKSDPDNPAYLDSMGWVLYKQGQFDQAAKRFEKATQQPGGHDPIILDHFGDTLYRAGDQRHAVLVWRQAAAIYQQAYRHGDDPDMKDLGKHLQEKIHAVQSHSPQPLNLPAVK